MNNNEFESFRNKLQKHFLDAVKDKPVLFVTNTDKEVLWNLYLDSFPVGTNEVFRERREYDCSCCRQFIKSFGNVCCVEKGKLITLWDFKTGSRVYQPVVEALSKYIKSKGIKDVFATKEKKVGVLQNHEQIEDGQVITWNHFQVTLPSKFVDRSGKSIGDVTGRYRDVKNVFQRSLNEILADAVNTVLELIAQKSLYKGDEWDHVLKQFSVIQTQYGKLKDSEKDIFCWQKSTEVGPVIGKIRNHSIGTLLVDISQGMDLNEAVRKYEFIVAPSNYKRPKAIYTQKMVEQAKQTVEELGLLDSLGRRHAMIEDITINNILFANRDAQKKISAGDVFDEMAKGLPVNPKKLNKVDEISVETFVKDLLPGITEIEVLFENKHISNLFSLIGPKDRSAPSLFKWNNNFSWAYKGNIADSMKERVKAAGGKIDGDLRFSIQWNEDGDNQDDYDAHCVEPGGNEIMFTNKGRRHPSSGMLDVDIIHPGKNIAVENIVYANRMKMKAGQYRFFVHNYSHMGGASGFAAEIEFDGQLYSYEYRKKLRQNEKVDVVTVKFSKEKGFEIVKSLPSTFSTKNIWGLETNQFHHVPVVMFSPNYWDGQKGIGHKHYFFIIKDCINDEKPNGFYNEFLKEELMQHKRVFEALGSKMSVEHSDNQLSGLGFSSTKRNSVVVKVKGNFTRTLRINF